MKIAHKHLRNHKAFIEYVQSLQDYEIEIIIDYFSLILPIDSVIISFLYEELELREQPVTLH